MASPAAVFFLLTVVLIPARLVFSPFLRGASGLEALATLAFTWAFAALGASGLGLVTHPPAALLLALLLFFGPLLVAPRILEAHRQGRSRREALNRGLTRFSVVASGLLLLFGLRALLVERPQPAIAVPPPARVLTDPLGLKHAPVSRTWRLDERGLKHLHLSSEAEPFERAVLKLKAELIDALLELDTTPDAAPQVTLWVPERFATPAARAALAREAALLNDVVTRTERRTARGTQVSVVFAFGPLPQ